MNKKWWNSVILDDSIPKEEIEPMMGNSYQLVVSGMTKKDLQFILLHFQSVFYKVNDAKI